MQRVVLYGTTLVVSTIGASLQASADLELIRIDPALPGAAERLLALQPSAVVFDLAAGQPDFAMSLLRQQPGLLLIGADPSSDDLLVLSSHAARALSVADLVAVIAHRQSHQAP